MNNKCIGCGASLQTDNKQALGYSPKLNNEYCQRCFRLWHHNELIIDARYSLKKDYLTSLLSSKKEALYCYVIDILTLRSFLANDYLKLFAKKNLVIFINKIDILPKNANFDKIADKIITYFKKIDFTNINLLGVYLTRKNDDYLKKIFKELTMNKYSEVIFCGHFNAGKSSLINFLSENKILTVSSYPATTLELNEIKTSTLTYYDMPGSMESDNFLMNIPLYCLNAFTNQKTIKPLIYQIKGRQVFYLEGLLWVEIETKELTTVIFYLATSLSLTRSKKLDYKSYCLNMHSTFAYNIDKLNCFTFFDIEKKDYEIPGLGFISLFKGDRLSFYVPTNTNVYESEILL